MRKKERKRERSKEFITMKKNPRKTAYKNTEFQINSLKSNQEN